MNMKKYSTKATQSQFIGKVKIDPQGGELTDQEVEEIKGDPWGQELIRKNILIIDEVKPSDIKESGKGKPPKPETPKPDGINTELTRAAASRGK
jgi:hypothetical protein